jgi:hypothetical protein
VFEDKSIVLSSSDSSSDESFDSSEDEYSSNSFKDSVSMTGVF